MLLSSFCMAFIWAYLHANVRGVCPLPHFACLAPAAAVVAAPKVSVPLKHQQHLFYRLIEWNRCVCVCVCVSAFEVKLSRLPFCYLSLQAATQTAAQFASKLKSIEFAAQLLFFFFIVLPPPLPSALTLISSVAAFFHFFHFLFEHLNIQFFSLNRVRQI